MFEKRVRDTQTDSIRLRPKPFSGLHACFLINTIDELHILNGIFPIGRYGRSMLNSIHKGLELMGIGATPPKTLGSAAGRGLNFEVMVQYMGTDGIECA